MVSPLLLLMGLVWEKKVKVTNISVLGKKGPAKLKSASKSKLALHGHLKMLPLPARHEAVRERHPFTLCSPLSGEYVISNSALSFIHIYIYIFIYS